MAETPIYRCRCGEMLFTKHGASGHLAHRDSEEHAYTAITDCERCGGDLGEVAVVHLGGVYCSGKCAHRAKHAQETPTQRGDTPV